METILSSTLSDAPRAAVIWLTLLVVAMLAFGGLLAAPARIRRDIVGRIRAAALPSWTELAAEARELERYAQEVAVAAEGAAATAERHRATWLAAQENVETAWSAYQSADADVRRLTAATALPLPRTPQTPAEYADRERFLHRAALDAYWRRELSVEQLSDVFAHRAGWDPRHHPVSQELVLRRVARDNLLARHRTAADQERQAWRDADLAATAARTLADEAFAAAERAHAARRALSPANTRRATRPAGNRSVAPIAEPTARRTRVRAVHPAPGTPMVPAR